MPQNSFLMATTKRTRKPKAATAIATVKDTPDQIAPGNPTPDKIVETPNAPVGDTPGSWPVDHVTPGTPGPTDNPDNVESYEATMWQNYQAPTPESYDGERMPDHSHADEFTGKEEVQAPLEKDGGDGPRYEGEKTADPADAPVRHNGQTITEVKGKKGAGATVKFSK